MAFKFPASRHFGFYVLWLPLLFGSFQTIAERGVGGGRGYSLIRVLRGRTARRLMLSGIFVLNGVSFSPLFAINGESLHGPMS